MINQTFIDWCNEVSQEDINEIFLQACSVGIFDKVKALLTSPKLNKHADIHYKNDRGLHFACENEHKDMVHYLLTSPELKEHADIQSDNNYVLLFYFNCENLEMLRYILSSPELKKHADITNHYENIFMDACEDNNLNILNFLIVEMKMNQNDVINKYLEKRPNIHAKHMFYMRELHQDLEKELYSDKIHEKKIKL